MIFLIYPRIVVALISWKAAIWSVPSSKVHNYHSNSADWKPQQLIPNSTQWTELCKSFQPSLMDRSGWWWEKTFNIVSRKGCLILCENTVINTICIQREASSRIGVTSGARNYNASHRSHWVVCTKLWWHLKGYWSHKNVCGLNCDVRRERYQRLHH